MTSSSWKTVLNQPDLDLESAVSGFFPNDQDFSRTVVETMDSILSSGDVQRWAELKRLDAHAAKHQRIASDYLLNVCSLVIHRLCLLGGGEYCKQFRDILYDRLENFHNQCRDGDSVPQSVSRIRAKHEMLHAYNVKSYASILGLVGVVLTRADDGTATELAKRIVSNHNHWFNLVHVVEFFTSLLVVGGAHNELLVALGPSVSSILSGICGIRLGMSPNSPTLMEATPGVTSTHGPVWQLLVDILEVGRSLVGPGKLVVVNAALNGLASIPNIPKSVVNRVISMLPDFEGAEEEVLNFLLSSARYFDVKDFGNLEYEFASRWVLRIPKTVSCRLRTLQLKWMRVMVYTSDWCIESLLGLDSELFAFVVGSLVVSESEPVVAAAELIRALIQRDSRTVGSLTQSTKNGPPAVAPLAVVMMKAFTLRPARKACVYILQQCVMRNPAAVRQILFGIDSEELGLNVRNVSQNIARVLLDSVWESEVDLTMASLNLAEIDFEALNQGESKSHLGNWSRVTMVGLNSVLEAAWFYKLEVQREKQERSLEVQPSRLEFWLTNDMNVLLLGGVESVYHTFTARAIGLQAVLSAPGPLAAELLGLVETSIGMLNNDLEKEILGVDALFLLVDVPPDSENSSIADLEYLYAVEIVAGLLDDGVNRQVMLRFIQYRWSRRFSILRELLSRDAVGLISVSQVSNILRVIGVELLVASQLIDSDAQHVRNMLDFGSAFLVQDLTRGRSDIMEYISHAYRVLEVNSLVPGDILFTLPMLKQGEIQVNEEILSYQTLSALAEAVVAVIVHWAAITNEAERGEVVAFLIESIEPSGNELWRQTVFAKIVPRLYALLNTGNANLLPFNFRTLKAFTAQLQGCKNMITKTGLVESVCYALTPFVASAEIWMVENDHALARLIVDSFFAFAFDVLQANGRLRVESISMPLMVLAALLATRNSFAIVEIVKDMTVGRYRHQIEKVLATEGIGKELFSQIVDIVEKEVLFKELAI